MSIRVTVMSTDFETEEEPTTLLFDQSEVSIGRADDNDIVLSAREVSGHHARLFIRNGSSEKQLCISDLGSANGTRIERKDLSPNIEAPIKGGERIIIANYIIRVQMLHDKNTLHEDSVPSDTGSEYVRPTFLTERETAPEVSNESSLNGASHSADEIVEINFEAAQVVDIFGAVMRKMEPVTGVMIDAGPLGKTQTDHTGRFNFHDVEDGTEYTIKLSKDGFRINPAQVSGTATEDSILSFEAERLLQVKGRVTNKGTPLAGVEVDGGPMGKTTTDQNGYYVFNNVPENSPRTVTASKHGFVLKKL